MPDNHRWGEGIPRDNHRVKIKDLLPYIDTGLLVFIAILEVILVMRS